MRLPAINFSTLDKQTLGNAKLRVELLDLFCEHAVAPLAAAKAALATQDSVATAAAAHRLKGSAATIAALSLADAAQRLEAAACTGDWSVAGAEFEAVERELTRCIDYIRGTRHG